MHRNRHSIERMNELGFRHAWTPRYSPEYNGIEEVIGIGKQIVKKKRLDMILTKKQEDLKKLIDSSFRSIDYISIAKCINRSLNLLNLT